MGILTMLQGNFYGAVNIIHYSSSTNNCDCKSVLAAELFTSIVGYDVDYTITHTLQGIFRRKTGLAMHTDNRSLHGLCISAAHTTERRTKIDLAITRDAY